MRRARATKGAEWSSRGVLRASRYCRQLVWGRRGAGCVRLALALPALRGLPPKPQGAAGWCWKGQPGVLWVSEAGLVTLAAPRDALGASGGEREGGEMGPGPLSHRTCKPGALGKCRGPYVPEPPTLQRLGGGGAHLAHHVGGSLPAPGADVLVGGDVEVRG